MLFYSLLVCVNLSVWRVVGWLRQINVVLSYAWHGKGVGGMCLQRTDASCLCINPDTLQQHFGRVIISASWKTAFRHLDWKRQHLSGLQHLLLLLLLPGLGCCCCCCCCFYVVCSSHQEKSKTKYKRYVTINKIDKCRTNFSAQSSMSVVGFCFSFWCPTEKTQANGPQRILRKLSLRIRAGQKFVMQNCA